MFFVSHHDNSIHLFQIADHGLLPIPGLVRILSSYQFRPRLLYFHILAVATLEGMHKERRILAAGSNLRPPF
jgi:hypothetical protein